MQLQENVMGRIASAIRERYVVWTDGGDIVATLGGKLRAQGAMAPCVGDWVHLREGAVITEVLPRRTELSRKEPGTAMREQVLAANVDVLLIVSGLDRDYHLRRLERYLVIARQSAIRAVVLLNKADLRADFEALVARTREELGVAVVALSARQGCGLDQIHRFLAAGETAALIGSSGAGKSTLVNALLAEDRQQTGAVRADDQKGRHTTTRRELFSMPGNWFLIDMPGLREVEPWANAASVDEAFEEVAELAGRCRFRDCRHENEPGCAVLAAGLEADRLAGYRKLRREMDFLEREADIHRARAEKQRWKAIEKAQRKVSKWR